MIYELDKDHYNETGETKPVILESGEESKILGTKTNIDNNKFIQGDKSQDPTYYGGLTNNFEYKGFDLNFLISFSGGNYILDYDEYQALRPSEAGTFKRVILEEAWQKPGDITKYPKLAARGIYIIDGEENTQFNTAWSVDNRVLYKGDYVRLKNVQIGYNLPRSVLNKWNINALRVYAMGTNLLTFTDYPGFDPEGAGYVFSAQIPQLKTYTIGLNVKF